MPRRKALFIELRSETPDAAELDLVRDYGGLGYLVVPVIGTDGDPDAEHRIRTATGARVTRPLQLDGTFAPQRIWEFARAQQLDLDRSVLVSLSDRNDGIFMTAGVRRILRPARTRLAA